MPPGYIKTHNGCTMKNRLYRKVLPLQKFMVVLLILLTGCSTPEKDLVGHSQEKNIGVLLLNHGSRSERWKANLIELEQNVSTEILAIEGIDGIRTAFMEHAEPSIASALKGFDREQYRHIVIIPIFLTIGTHMFDDIPTIIGQKENPASLEKLKLENIERYVPVAKTHLAPSLDFSDLLKTNTLRRTIAFSREIKEEGLVLIGYGSTVFDEQWKGLFDNVATYVCNETGITDYTTAWCGHIAHYSPDSTTAAVNRILEKKKRAIVIPLLVSSSEQFQIDIIGNGISAIDHHREKVAYKPDAILPDTDLEQWVIDVAKEYAAKIQSETKP